MAKFLLSSQLLSIVRTGQPAMFDEALFNTQWSAVGQNRMLYGIVSMCKGNIS